MSNQPTRAEIERAAAALLLDILKDFVRVLKESDDVMPVELGRRLTPGLHKASTIIRLLNARLEAVDLAAANALLEKVHGEGRVQ